MTLASDPRPFSFLRLPAAARRRKARPVVAVGKRLAKVSIFALPLGLLAGWLLFSPRFSVRHVETTGADRVRDGWVQAQLGEARSSSLLLLDLDELHDALAHHPWIRTLSISKRLPDQLLVQIEEHQPVAVLRAPLRRALVSSDGTLIDADGHEAETPRLEIVLGASFDEPASYANEVGRALQTGRAIRAAAPGWCRSLQLIEVLSPGHLRLGFEDLPFPLLVREESALERVLLFDRLRDQILERYAPLQHVDLRASRRVVLSPSERLG